MNDVRNFLKANNFTKVENNKPEIWCNPHVAITIHRTNYEMYNPYTGMTMYSSDLNIYWLIGVLTYYEYIPKDYNK